MSSIDGWSRLSCPRAPARRLAGPLLAVLLLAAAGLLSPAPAAAAMVIGPVGTARPPASLRAWQWPLGGTPRVLRGFEPPPTAYAAGHRGVDLAAPVGAPVLAAGSGVVGYAGMLAGRGVVTVVHGSLRTTYEPVTALVHPGQVVGRGAAIGHLQLGAHCGFTRPCLHWGLLRGRVYLDPLALLGLNAVRLLPVWTSAGSSREGYPAPAPVRQAPTAGRAGRGMAAAPLPAAPTGSSGRLRTGPTATAPAAGTGRAADGGRNGPEPTGLAVLAVAGVLALYRSRGTASQPLSRSGR